MQDAGIRCFAEERFHDGPARRSAHPDPCGHHHHRHSPAGGGSSMRGQLHRVLRLRCVRLLRDHHRGTVLSCQGPDSKSAAHVRSIRRQLCSPSARRIDLRPNRGPIRPTDPPDGGDPLDRHVHHRDRPAAHLRDDRRLGTDHSDPGAAVAGHLRWRGVRRSAGLHRGVRPVQPSFLLYGLADVHDRIGAVDRCGRGQPDDRDDGPRGVAVLGMADPLPGRPPARLGRSVHAATTRRDPALQGGP